MNKINDWLKIDVQLQEKLTQLQLLNEEREYIIAEAEQQGELDPLMQKRMEESVEKYERLAKEVAALKKIAKNIINNE